MSARVAVVTGAGQGLGRAVALALSAAGIEIAAVGRTLSKLDDTVGRLPGRGVSIAADLTNPDQVRRMYREVEDRLGGVDILVNCAADYSPFRIDEASDKQIGEMLAQSLAGAVYCTRDAINLMRRRGGGDIVNISSQSSGMPQPFMTLYGACKAALEALSEGLRYELKGEDFRVIVCQIGVVLGTPPNPEFKVHRERIDERWRATGIDRMFAFPGAPAETIAAAIVSAVTAPRSAHTHTIQIRGAPPLG